MRNTLLSFLFLVCSACIYAQKYTISGYVYDSVSKETLIGATIFDAQTKTGCVTNVYGFYSFATQSKRMEVSFVGYEKQILNLTQSKDTTINIYLKPSSVLQEFVVTDKQKRFINEAIPGKIEINPQIITKMPTLTRGKVIC